MTFTLTVDKQRWQSHIDSVAREIDQAGAVLIPVVKGNGYGFGRQPIAEQTSRIHAEVMCVGTVWEVESVVTEFSRLIHVLEPINFSDSAQIAKWFEVLEKFSFKIIATVGSTNIEQLADLGVRHIMLDCLTSLNRFGLTFDEIKNVVHKIPPSIKLYGFSLHLPIADSRKQIRTTKSELIEHAKESSIKVQEVINAISSLQSIHTSEKLVISVSHLSPIELKSITSTFENIDLQIRMGTELWLGAPEALQVTGTVLAIHDVSSNEGAGYTQTPGKGKLIIVSGGTSHGVALAAPKTTTTFRKKLIAIAEGYAQAFGRVRSPFTLRGKNLMFAEPPHMHVSMLWTDELNVHVGDKLSCTVRNTTANFDVVEFVQ